jgi:hypothetical protein
MDRNAKLLLLKLNRKGHEVTLIKEHRYSKEYGNIYARYKLTFWRKELKTNKKTGQVKEKSVPDTHEFKNAIELLRYMVVRANE